MPRQNTKPVDYPQAVTRQIELLARNIVLARKRRHETQAQWAKKLGVSQPTMARIEKGDPAVAMASYVMCMWLINPLSGLADLIAPQNDHSALEREIKKIRSRGTGPAQTVLQKAIPTAGLKPAVSGDSAAQTATGLAALLVKTQDKRP